jgi:hypothetical protein
MTIRVKSYFVLLYDSEATVEVQTVYDMTITFTLFQK